MAAPRKFLVVDDNSEGRSLLSRTLLRKFPQAVVLECQDGGSANEIAGVEKLDAIIAHRAGEMDGEHLVRALRATSNKTPIIMVSGMDRTDVAHAAGANQFLNYDEWLRLGTLVADMLRQHDAAEPPSRPS